MPVTPRPSASTRAGRRLAPGPRTDCDVRPEGRTQGGGLAHRHRLWQAVLLHLPGVVPDGNAWEKLPKVLNDGTEGRDSERFSGMVSQPFERGQSQRITVKASDVGANELERAIGATRG